MPSLGGSRWPFTGGPLRTPNQHGLILADTKFEFGRTEEGIILADEVLTPDSSRFWEASAWKPGGAQPSFDKQFVRDYLESIHWNKQAPAPSLPDDVVERTQAKYLEAFRRLTGRDLNSSTRLDLPFPGGSARPNERNSKVLLHQ